MEGRASNFLYVSMLFMAIVLVEVRSSCFSTIYDFLLFDYDFTAKGEIISVEVSFPSRFNVGVLDVCYRYSVLGNVYSGCRINFDSKIENYKKLSGHYREGDVVDVYYSPKVPNKSTLTVSGIGYSVWIHLLVVVVFAGVLFFIFSAINALKSRSYF